jgi:hypothetical protein
VPAAGDRPYSPAVESVPQLAFGSPRVLPRAQAVPGRVVVLDIAFAATVGSSVSFDQVTAPFLAELGDRLAAWVDHHDHERHPEFAGDPRFVLATKAEHGACPEMVTPELVRQVGPIDTILTHVDLDGLYAAAKWILGGKEPYAGADDDARAVDTRIGEPGPTAVRIDHALRARFRDDQLKRAVVLWLIGGMRPGAHADVIEDAARQFEVRAEGTRALTGKYRVRGRVAIVDAGAGKVPFDKTDLLLAGQLRAPVAMVLGSGMVTIAAAFGSGWDFVRMLALGGGMPTRVTVPESRFEEAVRLINDAPEPRPAPGSGPMDAGDT